MPPFNDEYPMTSARHLERKPVPPPKIPEPARTAQRISVMRSWVNDDCPIPSSRRPDSRPILPPKFPDPDGTDQMPVIRSWAIECLTCIVTVLDLEGIIIVLSKFDGQPLPDWPWGITLNTLLSVLVTILKASMAVYVTEALSQLKWTWFGDSNQLSDLALVDSASRGAIGALRVLFRMIPQSANLQLLALSGLIKFGCVIVLASIAISPFAQQVIATDLQWVQATSKASIQTCDTTKYSSFVPGAGPGSQVVSLATAGSIYSGIFQSQSANSDSNLVTCPTGNCTFDAYQSLGFCSQCANLTSRLSSVANETYYKYTLPNGFTLEGSTAKTYIMNATARSDLIQINATGLPLILNFTAITSTYGFTAPPAAVECALYFCVATYDAGVSLGNFNNTVVSTSSSSNYSTSPLAQANLAVTPNTCLVNGTEQQGGGGCTYDIEWLSVVALRNTLLPLLNGSGAFPIDPVWSSETVRAVYGGQGNYSTINSVFQSLSSSLTLHARSQVCNANVGGIAWTVESIIQVQWAWLTFPIILVGFSILFLFLTIIKTRDQYIWKSSPLALLFSNIRLDERFQLNPNLEEMEATSRKLHVRLDASATGVHLLGVKKEDKDDDCSSLLK